MTIPAEHLARDLTESLGRLGERTVGYARLGTGDGSGTIVADFAYRKVYYFDRDSSQVPAIAPLVQTINLISLNNPDLEGVRIRLGYPPYNPKVLHVLGLDTGEGLDSVAGITAEEQLTAKTLYPSVGNITNFRVSPQETPDTTVFVNASPYFDSLGNWSLWGGDSADLANAITALASGKHQMVLVCFDTVTAALVLLTNTASDGGQTDKDVFDWTTILSITIDVHYIPIGAVHIYFGQIVVTEDDIYRSADPRAAFGKQSGGLSYDDVVRHVWMGA